ITAPTRTPFYLKPAGGPSCHTLCAALALLLSLAAVQGSAQPRIQAGATTSAGARLPDAGSDSAKSRIPAGATTATPTATPPALEDIVEVKDIYNLRYHSYYDPNLAFQAQKGINDAGLDINDLRKAGLNERIVIRVKNLQALLMRSN